MSYCTGIVTKSLRISLGPIRINSRATCFDISKVNNEKCIICGKNAISTFPILPNEEFTFNYDEKHGVELEFGIKKDKNKK
ncbi:MAG: hypothetical protein WAQ29_10660 [Nitrososphaeraceae archaeon]